MKVDQMDPADAAALRKKAEEIVASKPPASKELSGGLDAKRLLHELQAHQVELEMQKAELQQSHDAQERLRKQYTMLYDFAPVGYLSLDRKGTIRKCNLAGANLVGVEQSGINSLPFSRFVDENDLPLLAAFLEKVFADDPEARTTCELRLHKKDGDTIFAQVEGLKCGSDLECLMVITDITQLRLAEQKFHVVADNIYDWEFWITPEDKVVYCSPSCERITGYAPANFLEDDGLMTRIIHPDDRNRYLEHHHDATVVHKEGEVDYRIIRTDGGTRWVAHACQPVYDEQGVFLGTRGGNRDITERKQMDETLARTSKEWSAAVDAFDEVIYLLDLNRHVLRANKSFYRLTGTTPETALGRHIAEIVHPQGEPLPCPVCRAQEEKRDFQLIMEADLPENPAGRPLEINVKIIHDQKDRPISILMVLRDLSNVRKEIEEKTALERQLQQSQKMESVGRLAGGVAHDFNNMLGAIIGNAELAMINMDSGHPLYASFQEILKSAHRSADLTRQLLAFARKQTVSPKVLNLNEAVEGMLKMLRRIIGEDILLNWQPGGNLWLIKIDPSQIDQILANLCVNARDALAGVGKLSIETLNRTLDEAYCAVHSGCMPGEYVVLSVSDTGCGMDKETLAQIFEPFYTTKDVGQGTGLGLATVYGVVKQNNGFINAYSELGEGTTFTIYLPKYVGHVEQTQKKDLASPPKGLGETVLLVEDESAILQMTTRMLERLNYSVLTASSPGEALRIAKRSMQEI